MVKISIIVIAYNEEKMLPLCLNSLMDLDYLNKDLEIIVVDNASTDETARIVKRYPVRYVFESHKNRAKARNKGIEVAQGEFVAFLDADCVARKDWLRRLWEGCHDSSVGACGGETYAYNCSSIWEKYAENRGFQRHEYSMNEKVLFPTFKTVNVIYPKSILENIGLFDETFYRIEIIA